MRRSVLFVTMMVGILMLAGCHNPIVRTAVDPSSIPDQTYEVTVYSRFMSMSYAVLLDIPEDGTEVFMRYTPDTERIGRNTPQKYIDEFDSRIKYYRVIRISDENDIVRGYLMISSVLNYWIAPAGERIIVGIEDRSIPR